MENRERNAAMAHISFSISRNDAKTVREIVDRAAVMSERVTGKKLNNDELRGWTMDIIACHANSCPIDFGRLLGADDFNFGHDVFGIYRHLDRSTGRLTNCFVPRFATPKQVAA
jgi:hypothetical protein